MRISQIQCAFFEAYDSLPAQLAKDAKKFQYKLIKSGARASQYGDAIDWLIRAGIVNKCMKCSQGFYPVAAYQDVSTFKLYYSDMGIMSARMGMTLEALRSKETEHFSWYIDRELRCDCIENEWL